MSEIIDRYINQTCDSCEYNKGPDNISLRA